MKSKLALVPLAVAAVGLMVSGASQASLLDFLNFNLSLQEAVIETPDDPTDPPGFFTVKPTEFDPAHTNLVQATWLTGIGCPNNAAVAPYPATTPTGPPYTDPTCATADLKDGHNEGLLMVKTGPTSNNAAAVAELKKVKGIVLTELGYDIRKAGGHVSAMGSHCGAGAPRFNVTTTMGFFFVGCSSPTPTMETAGQAWTRLRWGVGGALVGFNPTTGMFEPITGTVTRILIVFDEGTDTGLDFFGAAIIDNIDVNGALVGHGATDAD